MRVRNSLTVGYILDLRTINDGVEPCGLGCNSICHIMAKLRLHRLATESRVWQKLIKVFCKNQLAVWNLQQKIVVSLIICELCATHTLHQ